MNLDALKKANILVLGDIILDKYLEGSVSRVSPEAPVPVLRPESEEIRLGGAANVANNIKSIGGSAFLISKSANDRTSEIIKKLLISNKINFKIVTNKEYSSPIKKRIVQNDHQFCRLDDESFSKLKKKMKP